MPHPGRSITRTHCLDPLGPFRQARSRRGQAQKWAWRRADTLSRCHATAHAGVSPEMAIRLEKMVMAVNARARPVSAAPQSVYDLSPLEMRFR